MDSEYTDNPAGRLWLFLKYVTDRGTNVSQNAGVTFRDLFTEYFGEGIDDADYFSKMSSVMRLPVDVREQVAALERTPIPETILLRPLAVVQQFLGSHADGRHNVYRNLDTITDGVLNDLETCSHILSGSRIAPNPTDEERNKVRQAVSELISAILRDQTLPVDIRRVMLRYAHRIVVALDEYALRGPEAIAEANDALKGFVQANASVIRPKTDIWDKFTRASTIATLAVTVFTGPAQIGQAVSSYVDIASPPVLTEAPASPTDEMVLEVIEATVEEEPKADT